MSARAHEVTHGCVLMSTGGWSARTQYFLKKKDAACPQGHKAGDADRWGTWALGVRPGNGVAAFLLTCERGSHSHTVVVTRPRLRLALELLKAGRQAQFRTQTVWSWILRKIPAIPAKKIVK